ncbi:hypothetical protein SMC26_17620 [Actinomadura fulvescens]|uniref:Uncharacterized protein n=1 Tax=Actinomadura fulvescens TaxID=46160 RepID=A0ABP6CD67_9ACTN
MSGWDWKIETEKRLVDRYPAERRAASVTCADCGAEATISFDPQALDVSYGCPTDPEHGIRRLDGDEEPLEVWRHQAENELVALGLVAPVLAGQDDAWAMIYGTRAADYRSTVSALEAFDQTHPPRLRLTADIRCGDCGDSLRSRPEFITDGLRIEARYSCANRHGDGKYRRHEQRFVDEEIDWALHRKLREHPCWVTAAELGPDPGKVAAYVNDLSEKLAIFDAHIGAAKSVDPLVEIRSRLAAELDLVTRIRDHGASATADLTRYAAGAASYTSRWKFTDLARALLTERVDVANQTVKVVTPFDDGTELHRLMRSREIREELAELRRLQNALEQELAELSKD